MKIRWFCALCTLALLLRSAHAESPYNWPRLPTDQEIASARTAFQNALSGRVLYVEDCKFHREVTLDGVTTLVPLDCNGVYLKYGIALGGETISVNGQAVGTSAQREQHRLTYLRYDAGKDEFYFGLPRGTSSSALAAIAAVAESYPSPSAAELTQRIADLHKEAVQDLGNGHTTRTLLVDGWCAGSVAGSSVPTWIVAVGGVAAVAAAAAAMATALVRRTRGKSPDVAASKSKNDPRQAIGYVLQLSAKSLVLEPGNPATLLAKAWRVDAQGGYAPAPDAAITIAVQGGVQASPSAGRGTLQTTLSCTSPLPGTLLLTLTATAAGNTATETLEVKPSGNDMLLDMEGERESTGTSIAYVIRSNAASGMWDLRELVVWFTQPGSSQPARPAFTPVFGKPTLEPAIPGLSIGEPTTTDHLTWRFKLSLAPDATIDEQWLAQDGHVSVTIPCEEAPVKS